MDSLLHHSFHGFFFFVLFFLFSISPKLTKSYKLLDVDHVKRYRQILLPNATGPESIAFDCMGRGPYVSVADGQVLKWRGTRRGWAEYAVTSPTRNKTLCDGSRDLKMEQSCGRPLGLKFDNRTCQLYIADPYFGLLRARRGSQAAEQVATGYGGVAFKLINGLDVDTVTGEVYFTDSSKFYQRRDFVLALLLGDKSGRVMKYDPRTSKVSVVLSGLSLPNGLALSKDNSFLVIAETGKSRLLRFWLRGPRARATEVFARLERYPDNVKRNGKGEFWVGLNSGRASGEKEITSSEDKKNGEIPWLTTDPVAIKYGPDGRVMEVIDGKLETAFETVTEVAEFCGEMWIGTLTMPFVGNFIV